MPVTTIVHMGSRARPSTPKSYTSYTPMMSAAEARQRTEWQDKIYSEHLRQPAEAFLNFLGRRLLVPREVFQPVPREFNLMAATVLREVREDDAVLDMGTGTGIQAILAASKAKHVLAADINPEAVRCASRNVALNELGHRVKILQSDVFEKVRGRFDLILFDPPFRWTEPRDVWERSTADQGYVTLQRFFSQCSEFLTERGRIIISFGTSGDLAYLKRLIRKHGFRRKQLLKRRHAEGWEYFTYRVTRSPGAQVGRG